LQSFDGVGADVAADHGRGTHQSANCRSRNHVRAARRRADERTHRRRHGANCRIGGGRV